MAYVAKRRINIDGVIVEAGDTVPDSVPAVRCEQLGGRHLTKIESAAKPKAKSTDKSK